MITRPLLQSLGRFKKEAQVGFGMTSLSPNSILTSANSMVNSLMSSITINIIITDMNNEHVISSAPN